MVQQITQISKTFSYFGFTLVMQKSDQVHITEYKHDIKLWNINIQK